MSAEICLAISWYILRGSMDGGLLVELGNTPKLAGSQTMVHQRMALHGRAFWQSVKRLFNLQWQRLTPRISDNMRNRHEFSIGTGMATVCTELARPEGCH